MDTRRRPEEPADAGLSDGHLVEVARMNAGSARWLNWIGTAGVTSVLEQGQQFLRSDDEAMSSDTGGNTHVTGVYGNVEIVSDGDHFKVRA
ncbi:MAG: hypothetical protein WCV00_04830 [Verrucomicrobiia bacterium]|jgi:hypothetical protein